LETRFDKKSNLLLRIRQTNDSNYQWTTYKMFGPRIKQESFKDHNGTLLNGKCSYYFPSGYLDSAGAFLHGSMDGVWYYYRNMDGSVFRQKNYENGMVVKDTLYPVITKADREKIPHKPGEIESEYPGGQNAWARYLNHNLRYPDRAVNAEIMGDIRLQFIVDREGNIIDPEINKSVEYSLDEEALRIIKGSIKWTPAHQDGRLVKSYKIQPINFRLQKQ
jgi:periplasmic protein TonB